MITKEKQKREKRERRDPNKKEILFVRQSGYFKFLMADRGGSLLKSSVLMVKS